MGLSIDPDKTKIMIFAKNGQRHLAFVNQYKHLGVKVSPSGKLIGVVPLRLLPISSTPTLSTPISSTPISSTHVFFLKIINLIQNVNYLLEMYINNLNQWLNIENNI